MTYQEQLIAAHKARHARLWQTKQTAHKKAVAIRELVDRKIIASRREQEAREEWRRTRQRRWRKAKLLQIRAAEVRATGEHLIRWRDRNHAITHGLACAPWRKGPMLRELLRSVAEAAGVTVEDMKSRTRLRKASDARQEFYYLARALTSRSYPEIGRACGDRDHTTVIYGVDAHAKRHGLPPLTGDKA